MGVQVTDSSKHLTYLSKLFKTCDIFTCLVTLRGASWLIFEEAVEKSLLEIVRYSPKTESVRLVKNALEPVNPIILEHF